MYGVISLIFWAITLVVSIKYVTFILRADNDGEGGIMALTALLQKQALKTRRAKAILITLGIFGAALFYGDGIITPAISVLSAVEGLKVATPGLSDLVLPVAIGVLAALFLSSVAARAGSAAYSDRSWQRGSSSLPRRHPRDPATRRFSRLCRRRTRPRFIGEHGTVGFIALGSVVLAITGAEALYADMGHFGPSTDPPGLVFAGVSGPDAELSGPGRVGPAEARGGREPVLPDLPGWARIPMVFWPRSRR